MGVVCSLLVVLDMLNEKSLNVKYVVTHTFFMYGFSGKDFWWLPFCRISGNVANL